MKVAIVRGASEEATAVIVARTSRSPDTFDVIAAEVAQKGHLPFLEKNVLGYGHDSVAEGVQCPWVGIEDVSDLAANIVATSDPQLRVQMTSTRYQDMTKRGMQGPAEERANMEAMVQRYARAVDVTQAALDAMDHAKKRTLTMDIARCFLPAGISTQLAIRGDARTMRDACAYMLGHPLAEVRLIGERVRLTLAADIDKLFDRHLEPAPPSYPLPARWTTEPPAAAAFVSQRGVLAASVLSDLWLHRDALAELRAWRDSGWRRRMHITPEGPFLHANIKSDYGAYRDLRRNRTIHQPDLMPSALDAPQGDALWAFRELYPDVCDVVQEHVPHHHDSGFSLKEVPAQNAYAAPFGAMMQWPASGHLLNWAYALRLRSYAEARNPRAGCHPAYARPMRMLMAQLLEQGGAVASAMGIVESPKSWLGVEFMDRVPGSV